MNTDVIDIATVTFGTAALKSNGDIVTWGQTGAFAGIPSNVPGAIKLFGSYSNSYVLKDDGTVISGGSSTADSNVTPAGLTAWIPA
jgi:hypothetical protein